jgi:ABC-type antimicrobial peptide transport system permease subunit
MATRLGKKIGERVGIKANGVSMEYIISGFYSVTNNGGRMAAITLEGFQRLDPSYRRKNITVYLEQGIAFDEFSDLLTQNFGVVNVYKHDEDSPFARAKARAEEKISTYLEAYRIDSVEYAVIYNGEIILSGSSGAYQIEKIIDSREMFRLNIASLSDAAALLTEVFAIVSLIVISLILSMTVRSIVAKRRRELGALKASGFTTRQLARQLAISFMPMTAIGTILGCIGGAYLVNPAMDAMLASEGAFGTELILDPLLIALVGALTLAVTFVVANRSAMRIRRITVYELLSE